MTESTARPAVPALLGRYRPQSLIGRGGMAEVYRARDEVLGREVAVKVFRAGAEADLVQHALELQTLASLSHHGIVSLIDAGIDDSEPNDPRPILVMELIAGQNLQDAIAGKPLTTREISEIGYDIGEALEYVHSRGVLHRDIKPSNIMLVNYGTTTFRARARLTDFGLALDSTAVPSGGRSTTGTAAYLSPEQVARDGLTPASDVYSLGLVLLECFTRRLAFPGADVVESAVARLSEDPEVPDDLPNDWTPLLRRMTARAPEERPASAELTDAFRQAVIAASARHKAEPAEPHHTEHEPAGSEPGEREAAEPEPSEPVPALEGDEHPHIDQHDDAGGDRPGVGDADERQILEVHPVEPGRDRGDGEQSRER